MSGILEGIRIVDVSRILAGPYATQMLSDLGAEVIKIEKIGGEDMRNAGPILGNESVLFAMLNRGKKSIEINLKNKRNFKKIIDCTNIKFDTWPTINASSF